METQDQAAPELAVDEPSLEETSAEPDAPEEVVEQESAVAEATADEPEPPAEPPAETETSEDAAAAEEAAPEQVISSDMPEAKILDPATLRFYRAEDGTPRLEMKEDRTYLEFRASRLFPVTKRFDYLSIMDGMGDEIGVLKRLRNVPKPMRRLILEELRRRYLTPQITRVNSLKDEYGILYWDVDTSRGRREFVVREVRENIREFAGGRMMITDVDGNCFEIADLDALPGKGVSELYRLL